MEPIKTTSTTNLTKSHSFKVILAYLSPREKGSLRLLNQRVCAEHVPYFQNHLTIQTIQRAQPDIIVRFLTKSIAYNITSLSVVFAKLTLHYTTEEFLLVSNELKDKVTSLKMEFVKKSAPAAHHNATIAKAVQNFTNLQELTLIGAIQNNTVEMMSENGMETFKNVEKLVLDFESLKKDVMEKFISLFPAIKHLEIAKRNINIYPFLINNGMKVTTLKVNLPVFQIVKHMYTYLKFIADQLQEFELSVEAYDPNLLSELKYHRYLSFPRLRKLKLYNVQESLLKDYFRDDNNLFLNNFSLQSNQGKGYNFYNKYMKKMQNGQIEEFLHEFHGDSDYDQNNLKVTVATIAFNLNSMKTLKLIFNQSKDYNMTIMMSILDVILKSKYRTQIETIVIIEKGRLMFQGDTMFKKVDEIAAKQGTAIQVHANIVDTKSLEISQALTQTLKKVIVYTINDKKRII